MHSICSAAVFVNTYFINFTLVFTSFAFYEYPNVMNLHETRVSKNKKIAWNSAVLLHTPCYSFSIIIHISSFFCLPSIFYLLFVYQISMIYCFFLLSFIFCIYLYLIYHLIFYSPSTSSSGASSNLFQRFIFTLTSYLLYHSL